MKAVSECGGSNEYAIPRSGDSGPRQIAIAPYSPLSPSQLLMIRAERKACDLKFGDRVYVRIRTQEGFQWFQGSVHAVIDEGLCWIKYDDGDLFADYFDNREGSVKWKRI